MSIAFLFFSKEERDEGKKIKGITVAFSSRAIDKKYIDHIRCTCGVLDGGTGIDTMFGGLGNDTYRVDQVGDVVTECANEGTDLVVATS